MLMDLSLEIFNPSKNLSATNAPVFFPEPRSVNNALRDFTPMTSKILDNVLRGYSERLTPPLFSSDSNISFPAFLD